MRDYFHIETGHELGPTAHGKIAAQALGSVARPGEALRGPQALPRGGPACLVAATPPCEPMPSPRQAAGIRPSAGAIGGFAQVRRPKAAGVAQLSWTGNHRLGARRMCQCNGCLVPAPQPCQARQVESSQQWP